MKDKPTLVERRKYMLCMGCGNPERVTRTHCAECREKVNEHYRNRYRLKAYGSVVKPPPKENVTRQAREHRALAQLGVCRLCGEKTVPGKWLCAPCGVMERNKARTKYRIKRGLFPLDAPVGAFKTLCGRKPRSSEP